MTPDTRTPRGLAGAFTTSDQLSGGRIQSVPPATDNAQRHGPEPWPAPRSTMAKRKLAELCDADHRRVNPGTAAVASAVIAGAPMPDPHTQRDAYHAVIDAARAYLTGEPSPRAARAAGRRLASAITTLAAGVAEGGG